MEVLLSDFYAEPHLLLISFLDIALRKINNNEPNLAPIKHVINKYNGADRMLEGLWRL